MRVDTMHGEEPSALTPMATDIRKLRFDRRRSKLATELVASLTENERKAMALVMRHTVSGRWAWGVASHMVVTGQRLRSRDKLRFVEVDDAVVCAGLSSLMATRWLRFAEMMDGRGNFWMSGTAEDMFIASGTGATDLDPAVPE